MTPRRFSGVTPALTATGSPAFASGHLAVSGTHTYAVLGSHTITVGIVDDGGSTATAATHVIVFAFARGGSFVIGNHNRPSAHIVVVKTNPGYRPNPGHAGTGTVVAQVC
jgi:hypothetical protein